MYDCVRSYYRMSSCTKKFVCPMLHFTDLAITNPKPRQSGFAVNIKEWKIYYLMILVDLSNYMVSF